MQPQQYGIKVAQPGYDVRTAKDYQLIFNSSWPVLSIVYDQTMSVTTDFTASFSVAHNLNFTPLAMAWVFTDSTMTVQLGRVFLSPSKTTAYCIDGGLSFILPNTTYYVNIKCYNIDITIPQQYNYLQSAPINGTYDKSYGIKVVKSGGQMQSTDLRSFILHSRAASPQVLAVVTDQTTYNATTGIGNQGTSLIYTNPQGYLPWIFGYAVTTYNNETVYQWTPPNSQALPVLSFSSTGTTLLSLVNPYKGSLVILRDPLFAANIVQAQY